MNDMVTISWTLLTLWAPLWTNETQQEHLFHEYDLKSKLIFNIIKFTKWSRQSQDLEQNEFIFAILGDDPFGPFIDRFHGRTLVKDGQSFTIVIRRFHKLAEVGACHVLFVSNTLGPETKIVLDHVKETSILTIGDSNGFLEKGGIVNLIQRENQVHFEVNLIQSRHVDIDISARVLKLASRIVR